MKKIYFFVLCMFVLLSCEQNELDFAIENQSNDSSVGTTRATTSIADFNPLLELAGIPVNIKNVGNINNKFLSCAKKGTNVDLFNNDDGSLRQRWYIQNGNIFLVGGNSSIPSNLKTVIGPHNPDNSYPLLLGINSPYPVTHFFSLLENERYYYIGHSSMMSFPVAPPKYLQSNSANGSNLVYKEDKSSNLALWEIVPVGRFNIIKMEYEKSATYNDYINQEDMFLDGATIGDLPESVEHVFNISRTISTSSSFSEAYGVSTQNQSSFGWNLGLKVPVVNIGLNGQINNSVSSSQTTTFGEKTDGTVNVSQSFKVTIPAHSPCRIEVLKRKFNASITYVATLEKADGAEQGKRFRIKGRWEGIVVSDLLYNIYNMNNQVVDTKVID